MDRDEKRVVDPRLRSPFTMLISGPTSSGKTVKVMELIDYADTISNPPPEQIIYCYDDWQPIFDNFAHRVTFHEGVIDVSDIPNDGKPRWLILDDLMDEVLSKPGANDLFTKRSHHRNISVIFLVQNLFHKNIRTISINCHYTFLAKNPRDASSVANLAKQAFPGRSRYVLEAYRDATREPHSFLLLDMRQETRDDRRLLGNYPPLPDRRVVIYSPKRV